MKIEDYLQKAAEELVFHPDVEFAVLYVRCTDNHHHMMAPIRKDIPPAEVLDHLANSLPVIIQTLSTTLLLEWGQLNLEDIGPKDLFELAKEYEKYEEVACGIISDNVREILKLIRSKQFRLIQGES